MQLNPQEIVQELDKYIIGQNDAKKSVAIALRNRWRRQQIEEPMRSEITPKNILMIGPTGVGKTEIARRLAKLSNAPFIKIEATKFTEVGYVGKDVESIIRDLIEIEIKNRRKAAKLANYEAAKEKAIEKILEILVPNTDSENTTKQKFKEKLLSGELDDTEIEVDIAVTKPQVGIMMPPALEEMTTQLQSIFEFSMEKRKKTVKMPIKNALKTFIDEESHSLINEEDIKQQSIINTEQNGIVFIDEIDKVAIKSSGSSNSEISRAGVQRDLLPLVEGTTVNTKYGMIKTDHILFIASGAFHISKPSDLLPELQGRFPIRVELKSLTVQDFEQILSSTHVSLIEQYKSLLATEGVTIDFKSTAINKMAEIAHHVNDKTENIGARRLYTIMERLLDDISYDPNSIKKSNKSATVKIDAKFVEKKLNEIAKSEDLSRYIL